MPGPDNEAKRKAARETIDILHEISTLLVCSVPGLTKTPRLYR